MLLYRETKESRSHCEYGKESFRPFRPAYLALAICMCITLAGGSAAAQGLAAIKLMVSATGA